MSGFGRTLQEARRRKGLTLDEVERETRIRKRYLLALEQDEYDQLPPPVYALGFIKVYARYLDLDPAPLAHQFAEATGTDITPVPLRKKAVVVAPLPASARESSAASSVMLVIIVAAAILLAGSRLKDPVAAAIAGLGRGDQPAVTAATGQPARSLPADAPSRTTAATAPASVGEAAGGGDAIPPSTDSAPRLMMTPPWFHEPLPASDPKAAAPAAPVPSVVGQTFETARTSLEQLGLAVATEAWSSGSAPKGVVLWQQPEAGTSLKKGQLTLLAVSKGPKLATIPEVVGKTQADAAKALQQAGIVNPPVVNFQGPKDLSPSVLSGVCNGCVLSVSPPPGADTPPDSIVAVAIRKD